jgi:hypothetical protein
MDKDCGEGEPRMDYYPKKLLYVHVNRGETILRLRKTDILKMVHTDTDVLIIGYLQSIFMPKWDVFYHLSFNSNSRYV